MKTTNTLQSVQIPVDKPVCNPPEQCHDPLVCFQSAKTKYWHMYPKNVIDGIDRLAFNGVVWKPERTMSIQEQCSLPGKFEIECEQREDELLLECVSQIFIFHPFVDWGGGYHGLCAQDGKITTDPDESREWIEWHIVKCNEEIYEIEVAERENTCEIVYRGKIPSNKFLHEVLKNIETPPPLYEKDGETFQQEKNNHGTLVL